MTLYKNIIKPTFVDILIIMLVLMFACYFFISMKTSEAGIQKAIVFHQDQTLFDISLSKDHVVSLEEYGIPMILAVKNGKIKVVSASCSHQICVQKGWIQHPHDPIICAPNKIIVEIQGEMAAYDAITR